MKHLKKFENYSEPQIGDYVFCIVPPDEYEPNQFIGKIEEIKDKRTYPYRIKYKDEEYKLSCRRVNRSEIINFSKNKKDLEPYLYANKYNL